MDWTKNARLARVDGENILEDASKYDGVVLEIGSDARIFAENIQRAHDQGKPAIILQPFWMTEQIMELGTLDTTLWKINYSNFPLLKFLNENLVNKIFHGIILDISDITRPNGKTYPIIWVRTYAWFLLKTIRDRYNVPVFLTFRQGLWNQAVADGDEEHIIQLMEKWGICPVAVLSNVVEYPEPTVNPILPYNDTTIMHWDFWLYKIVAGSPWLFLYNGTVAQLYEKLKFTVGVPPVDPEPEPEPETELTTDEMVKRIYDWLFNRGT